MLWLCLLVVLAGEAFGRSTKIIGGVDAPVGAWPHQGSLQYLGSHNCGCALISATWVVTAAHCVGSSVSSYGILLGATDLTNSSIGDPTLYSLALIIQNEHYMQGPGSFPNDIAVVQLANVADLASPYIDIIDLAPSGADYQRQLGWITGWGYTTTGDNGQPATWLQQAEIEVYTYEYCEGIWGANSIVPGMHVCVGVPDLRASCNGDSGGPLVVDGVLAGVTSWGVVGCYPSYPSVYTGIAYFRDWINEKTGV